MNSPVTHGINPAEKTRLRAFFIVLEIEGVLKSREFARAEQLRELLAWLCARKLAGERSFTEYEVGAGGLKRGVDFDPLGDSIVRKEMARLRAKLARYYAGEGQADVVRISLPAGTYEPRFEPSQGAARRRPCLVVRTIEALQAEDQPSATLVTIELMRHLAVNHDVAPRYRALSPPTEGDVVVEGVLHRHGEQFCVRAWLAVGDRAFVAASDAVGSSLSELAGELVRGLAVDEVIEREIADAP